MNNQDKSKEQLLKELQELQRTHESLKISVEADLLEHKLTEVALRASEERFQLLFNKAPLSYQSLDSDGFFIEVNQQWLDTLGYEREEVIGKWFGDFLSPTNLDSFRKRFPIFKAQGYTHGELEMVHKNGQLLSIAFDGRVGYDVQGNFKQTHCILQDITQRKQAEEKLRESEENLSITLNSIGDGVISTDIQGLIVRMNPVAEKLCGWTLNDALGKPITEVFHIVNAQTHKAVANPLRKALEYDEIVSLAKYTVLISKDGTEYQISDSAAPIKNNEGEISGMVLVFSDVTEKSAAQKRLVESESFLKETQTIAQLGTYTLDLTTSTWSSSAILDAIFGIERDHEKSVEGWISTIHPDWQKIMADYFAHEVIEKKQPFDKEYQIVRESDQETRWVHDRGKLEFDKDRMPVRMLGTIHDITDRKQTEEAIRKSETKQNKMVSNIGDVIAIIDKNGINQYKSANITSLFGWLPEELVGKSTWDNVHPDDLNYAQIILNELAMKPNATNTTEIRYKRKDNTYVWIEITMVNLLSDPDINGILANYHEITQRKQAEQELIIAKEHAEESDRLKSAFLANMSHEIRTPMNGIMGFAELLKEPDLTGKEQQKYIDIIQKSGNRMLNIINDIIDISKIEAGLMKMKINETNINEQIKYMYTFFRPEIKAKKIKFSFLISLPVKKAIIQTDREKLYSILTNLLKNAIKYTDEGSIEFGYILKTDTLPGELEFYIKDTGIGIEKERQEAIFERFIQADIEDIIGREGAGLGLAISKSYVEMLGGKIWVESEEGIGSTFYFTLPYNPVPEERIVLPKDFTFDKAKNQVKNLKILIAEDDEVSGMLIEIALKMFGKSILKAQNGLEAVEISRTNPDIDMILMDIQMPKMNGYEATRQIRQFNKEVIIIAQTACGLSGDREIALAAGCDDYIAKPVSKTELLAIIQKYLK